MRMILKPKGNVSVSMLGLLRYQDGERSLVPTWWSRATQACSAVRPQIASGCDPCRAKSHIQVRTNSFSQAIPHELFSQYHCHQKSQIAKRIRYRTSPFQCLRVQRPRAHGSATYTQYHRDFYIDAVCSNFDNLYIDHWLFPLSSKCAPVVA